MTEYFIRKSGSDANNGTSAATAFATLGKALGASGVAVSGDTVWIGAGIYREQLTVGVTPTSALTVTGDVDGLKTGDAGEVRLTAYLFTDLSNGSATALNANSKNFLVVSKLVIQSKGASAGVSNWSGHDCSLTDCAIFTPGGGGGVVGNTPVDTNAANVIDRCFFYGFNGSPINCTAPTSAVADYNVGWTIRNCVAMNIGATAAFLADIASSGAQTFKGGGVIVQSCSAFGMGLMRTTGTLLSTSIPCQVLDSFCHTVSTGLTAGAAGQITEDGNYLYNNTARANVTAGAHSVAGTSSALIVSIGHERIWGGRAQPFGTFERDSMLAGFGARGTAPTVDILNRDRPAGTTRILATGTLTGGTATTATDSGAAFGNNAFCGAVMRITGGTGSGQVKLVKSHTPTAITVHENWTTTPDATSTYVIYFGCPAESGTLTGATGTTATVSSASWDVNMWAGFTIEIVSGTGNGQTNTITSNTATVLTVPTWGGTTPDNTSVFKIYRQTGIDAINNAAGALERHNTVTRETVITDAGGVGWRIPGKGDQEIQLAVDATSTTWGIMVGYNTDHGTTNKPQIELLANPSIGVTAQTVTTTSTGAMALTSFAPFTPTGKGVVKIRLHSRSDKPTGYAAFDTVSVS